MLKMIAQLTMVLALSLALAACDRDEKQQTETSAAFPPGLILPDAPAGAQDLAAARKSAQDGDQVVVRAIVGGLKEPFVASRAVMTVMDKSIKSCDQLPGDSCATPWDYCCEEDLRAKAATIQVLGADGQPLKTGLKGVGGLKPLSEVVVKGTLRKTPDGNVTINAAGLHVMQ